MTVNLTKEAFLSHFTSWRVGGIAERLYLPEDLKELSEFLAMQSKEEPLLWIGLGSNLLVRDGGVKGTVIVTQKGLNQLALLDEITLRAEAGVACPQLARFSARNNLEGLEFLAGIPGTVGGALMMNAGCHGGQTWEYVKAVEMIDRAGNIHLRSPSEFSIAYRHVVKPLDEWFVAAHFALQPGDKEISLDKIRDLLAHRAATQPTSEHSCGSVFRNPPNDYAAHLIESAGLKGKRIGGASVSEKHANFIISDETASARDIETLIGEIEQAVEAKHGTHLIREVHIVGERV